MNKLVGIILSTVFFFSLFLFSSNAFAARFKIALFAERDQKSLELAFTFAEIIRTAEPFRRMGNQLEIVVYHDTRGELQCFTGYLDIPNLLHCNSDFLERMQDVLGVNRMIAVTSRFPGAAGGSRPVLGNNPESGIVLHELFHTFGLGDEYDYTTQEQFRAYCNPPSTNRSNTVLIRPFSFYSSNMAARSLHKNQIPWFSDIKPTTLIISGSKLGTTEGIFPPQDAGLYRGGECSKWVPTWKPYYNNTIMRSVVQAEIMPLHSKIVIDVMQAEIGELISLKPMNSPDRDPRISETRIRGGLSNPPNNARSDSEKRVNPAK